MLHKVLECKGGTAEGKTDYAKSINSYLDTLQQKVFEAKRQLIELDHEVTPTRIKDLMLGKKINQQCYMVMEQFKQHNEQMKALVGKDYSASTLVRYETSYKHTLHFIESKYKVSDMDITKLDYDFISNYGFWLKTVRKCDHNTTIKYLSNLKKIVNHCVRSGRLQRDPFLGFSMAKKEVERDVLTEDQLKKIAQENFNLVTAKMKTFCFDLIEFIIAVTSTAARNKTPIIFLFTSTTGFYQSPCAREKDAGKFSSNKHPKI